MDKLNVETMQRIVHDVVLNIPPEKSTLAPMTPAELDFRKKVEPEIEAIHAKGGRVELGSFA